MVVAFSGRMISKYCLVRELGEGTFGMAYLAIDT